MANLQNNNYKQKASNELIALKSEPNIKVSKFSISFFERKTSKKSKISTVYLMVNYNGKTTSKSLSILVKSGFLHKKTFEIKGNEIDTNRLKSIESKLLTVYSGLKLLDKKIDVNNIINNVLFDFDIIKKTPDFLKICNNIYQDKEADFKNGIITLKTLKRYKLNIERLQSICYSIFNKNYIELDEINFQSVETIYRYLKYDCKFEPESIRKILDIGKQAYKIAIKNQWYQYNPFSGISYDKSRSKINEFLTINEIELLDKLLISNDVYKQIRDVFIFQCYTSLAYTDAVNLKHEHIKLYKGHKTIFKEREKTKSQQIILLFPKALEIIDKYQNIDSVFCLPTYSNQFHNRILKELSILCGINKPVTTHWGRKSFGQLMIALGISKEALQGVYGHKSILTTEKYYTGISTDRTINEMLEIQSKL